RRRATKPIILTTTWVVTTGRHAAAGEAAAIGVRRTVEKDVGARVEDSLGHHYTVGADANLTAVEVGKKILIVPTVSLVTEPSAALIEFEHRRAGIHDSHSEISTVGNTGRRSIGPIRPSLHADVRSSEHGLLTLDPLTPFALGSNGNPRDDGNVGPGWVRP